MYMGRDELNRAENGIAFVLDENELNSTSHRFCAAKPLVMYLFDACD